MSKRQAWFDYPVKSQKQTDNKQYPPLIYTNESQFEALAGGGKEKDHRRIHGTRFSVRANGQYLGGNRRDLTSKATTARRQEVGHGGLPSRKPRNNWGGCFLVEASDLDEAIRVAGNIPAARWGSI